MLNFLPDYPNAPFFPLLDCIRNDPKLQKYTLILSFSDNSHEPGTGSSDHLHGVETCLYEGGIRTSPIVWGPGLLAKNSAKTINDESVPDTLNINRSLYTGTELPDFQKLSGEDLLPIQLGKST